MTSDINLNKTSYWEHNLKTGGLPLSNIATLTNNNNNNSQTPNINMSPPILKVNNNQQINTTKQPSKLSHKIKHDLEKIINKTSFKPMMFEQEVKKVIQNNQNNIKPNTTLKRRKNESTSNENSDIENEIWEKQNKKKTIKTNKKIQQTTSYIDENRYSSLESMNIDNEEETSIINDEPNPQSKKINERPPPLYLPEYKDMKTMIQVINSLSLENNFTVNEEGKTNLVIHARNINDFKTIKNKLIELKIKFFTYTPRSEKPINVILKGIKGGFTIDEIETALKKEKLDDVKIIKINKYTINKNDPDNYHILVQISNNSNKRQLTSLSLLLNQRIYWENLRPKAITQCTKCQRVNHTSKNCHLDYRCVKCANYHEAGKCTITNTDCRELLTCANCKAKGHPATYSGCPYIKAAKALKEEAKLLQKTIDKTNVNNEEKTKIRKEYQKNKTKTVNILQSYASITKQQTQNKEQENNTQKPTIILHDHNYQLDHQHQINNQHFHQQQTEIQQQAEQQPIWVTTILEQMQNMTNSINQNMTNLASQVHRNSEDISTLKRQLEEINIKFSNGK